MNPTYRSFYLKNLQTQQFTSPKMKRMLQALNMMVLNVSVISIGLKISYLYEVLITQT